MDDEERVDYMEWRGRRDVVRGKSVPISKPDPKPEDKKPKKPFTDRVMEKALDHIKKQIEKVGVRRELPVRASA
jgi:hypothetical protein